MTTNLELLFKPDREIHKNPIGLVLLFLILKDVLEEILDVKKVKLGHIMNA